jgi:hypothetical protein
MNPFQVLQTTLSTHYWANFTLHENIVGEFHQFENTFAETYTENRATPTRPINPSRQAQRRNKEVSERSP